MAKTIGQIDPRQVTKFLRSKSVREEEPYEQLGKMKGFVSTERETRERTKAGDVRLPSGGWVKGSILRGLAPEARGILMKEGTAGLDIWRVGKAEEEARGRLEVEASKKEQELKLILGKEAAAKESEARARLSKEAAKVRAELEKIRQSLLVKEKALESPYGPVLAKPVEPEPKPGYYTRKELFKELGSLVQDYGKPGGSDLKDFAELASHVKPADKEFAQATIDFVQGYGTKYDLTDFAKFAEKWEPKSTPTTTKEFQSWIEAWKKGKVSTSDLLTSIDLTAAWKKGEISTSDLLTGIDTMVKKGETQWPAAWIEAWKKGEVSTPDLLTSIDLTAAWQKGKISTSELLAGIDAMAGKKEPSSIGIKGIGGEALPTKEEALAAKQGALETAEVYFAGQMTKEEALAAKQKALEVAEAYFQGEKEPEPTEGKVSTEFYRGKEK